MHPDVPLYNMAFVFHIDGALDEDAFVSAFTQLVAEAEALRTVLMSSEGVAGQTAVGSVTDPIEVVDLTAQDAPSASVWAKERCAIPLDMAHRTFDSALLRLPGGCHAWYLNQHHVVTDAWAMAILYQRMEQLYLAAATGAAPDGQPPARIPPVRGPRTGIARPEAIGSPVGAQPADHASCSVRNEGRRDPDRQ